MFGSPLFWGLMLGIRHAAEADHVATIASVVVGRTSLVGAVRTAMFWGLGHTLTFFSLGLAIVLFGLRVPGGFELGLEALIAASLLVLGAGQLSRAAAEGARPHAPHAARPLALGCMHGLAGSAAVALIALAAIPSELQALLYLALFGLGTVLGMAAISFVLAWSFQLTGSRRAAQRALVAASGLASAACGAWIFAELWLR